MLNVHSLGIDISETRPNARLSLHEGTNPMYRARRRHDPRPVRPHFVTARMGGSMRRKMESYFVRLDAWLRRNNPRHPNFTWEQLRAADRE